MAPPRSVVLLVEAGGDAWGVALLVDGPFKGVSQSVPKLARRLAASVALVATWRLIRPSGAGRIEHMFERGGGSGWDEDVPAALVAVLDFPAGEADWGQEFSSLLRSYPTASTGSPGSRGSTAQSDPVGRPPGALPLVGRPGSDGVSQELVERITSARRAENRAVWRQLVAVSELLSHWRGGVNAPSGADPDASFLDASADGPVGELVPGCVVAEVALACGMSEYATGRRLEAASALITDSRLPRTADLLQAGVVDWAKVSMLVRETRVLTCAAANAVDALVAPMAAELNVPRLTRAVRAAVAAVDPAGHQARAQEARQDRSVGVRAGEDGMGEINVWAPMEAVTAVQVALDAAVARARAAGDPRSPGQVRCDELITRVTGRNWSRPDPGGTTDPTGPTGTTEPTGPTGPTGPTDWAELTGRGSGAVHGPGGARVLEGSVAQSPPSCGHVRPPAGVPRLAVTLTMTLSTWLGLRDDPATLVGGHLVPAGLARDLAVGMADATWRCAVVDDQHTTLLGLGRPAHTDAYVPTARLAEFVRTAEPLCTFPGCGIRAARCDLDHRVPPRRRHLRAEPATPVQAPPPPQDRRPRPLPHQHRTRHRPRHRHLDHPHRPALRTTTHHDHPDTGPDQQPRPVASAADAAEETPTTPKPRPARRPPALLRHAL